MPNCKNKLVIRPIEIIKYAKKIGNSNSRAKNTRLVANSCPKIAIHLKNTKVFLSKLRFSPNLNRVEKFIVIIKYQG